jgi:phosphoglycerol transferase
MALFLISLALAAPFAKTREWRIAASLVTFLYACLFAGYYAINYFTGEGITPGAIYTLRYGLDGAGLREYPALAAQVCGFMAAVCVAIWFFLWRNNERNPLSAIAAKVRAIGTAILFAASITTNPALHDAVKLARRSSGAAAQLSADYSFASAYKKPALQKISPIAKNIVYIYAESLERTYLDEKLFPGLMPDLKRLEPSAVSFTGIEQLPESWWTMGGMVASQCGLPLALFSGHNSYSGAGAFMPGATCMGDLLKREGYSLSYVGGASEVFAGKGNFYGSHGFGDVSGLDELAKNLPDPSYRNGWGLYDDTLFGLAYDKAQSLAQSGKPFGVFMITLDTHPPGYVSRSCGDLKYGDGKNATLNAVHCDQKLIADFITRLRAAPFGKDTLVVLGSDHISMHNNVYDTLRKGERKNMLMLFSPDAKPQTINRNATPFDIGPTVLHALGYKAELGLGRDMFADDSIVFRASERNGGFPAQWLEAARGFWQLPKAGDILIKPDSTVNVNGRLMKAPMLIEMPSGSDGGDNYYFNEKDNHQLGGWLAQFAQDTAYVYIDECKNMAILSDEKTPLSGNCVATGKPGSTRRSVRRIDGNIHLDAQATGELRALPSTPQAYAQNLSRLVDEKLRPQTRALVDYAPDGSNILISYVDQYDYARAYARLKNRKLDFMLLHSQAAGKQFYSLESEIYSLQDPALKFNYQKIPGTNGIIRVTKLELADKSKKFIINDAF